MKVISFISCALAFASYAGAMRMTNKHIDNGPFTSEFLSGHSTNWAVLVAGSSGYFNYRHQADISHAYQILKKNNFPEERVITLMYDDAAHSRQNPFPGTLINRPGGEDVYKGVVIDYKGRAVNPDTFIAVLTGDKEKVKGLGSEKVLESGPNDNVFVYFADHGGVGLIAFPSGYMSSKSLNDALNKMYDTNMYGKMAFYMEACESGSMFQGLLKKDMNIYATTAANADQSSYACYWDGARGTFLGDLYSVKWMEDSDRHFDFVSSGQSEEWTLYKQYLSVKANTTMSEVCEFGDVKMRTHQIEMYQSFENTMRKRPELPKVSTHAVDSRSVTAYTLQQRIKASSNIYEITQLQTELETELRQISNAKMKMLRVVQAVSPDNAADFVNHKLAPLTHEHHICLDKVIRAFDKYCAAMDEYHMRFTSLLAKACQHEAISTEAMVTYIVNHCEAMI